MREEKIKLGKDILVIAVITFITVVSWIILEVYRASQLNTIPQPTIQQMKNINPSLKREIFDQLDQRLNPTQEQISQAIETNIINGRSDTITTVATSSGNKASGSGTLNE